MSTVETIKNPIKEVLEMVAGTNKGANFGKRDAESISTELTKVQTGDIQPNGNYFFSAVAVLADTTVATLLYGRCDVRKSA